MQGLTLGQGGHPAHPAAQFVQPGPLGYQMVSSEPSSSPPPGQCHNLDNLLQVYGVAPGPSSLPHLDPQPGAPAGNSPVEAGDQSGAVPERGQSN